MLGYTIRCKQLAFAIRGIGLCLCQNYDSPASEQSVTSDPAGTSDWSSGSP